VAFNVREAFGSEFLGDGGAKVVKLPSPDKPETP
jgi:hypothetical protein